MLVAIDGIGRSEDRAKLNFCVQAWKAAYQKARAVGWLHPLVSRSLARSPAVAGESFPSCCMPVPPYCRKEALLCLITSIPLSQVRTASFILTTCTSSKVTPAFVPGPSGSAVEMVTIDPLDLQAAQDQDATM
jgi:hypothetical protein